MKCHESSAKVKWESIWAETCHLALLTIHWNSVTWLSDWKRNFFLQFFGGAYYNIQNIKYSPVWNDLSWLELTFHKKQEIMTSSILPTYPRGTIAFAMNVKCFSVIGLSRPFQSFVGKTNANISEYNLKIFISADMCAFLISLIQGEMKIYVYISQDIKSIIQSHLSWEPLRITSCDIKDRGKQQ